jgi:hypothetical protein
MGGTGVKKNNYWVMVDRKCTRHYCCPFGEFGECGEVHPSLADLDHLPLALAGWTGCLPLERLPRLRAILDEMGRASAVETMIVAVAESPELFWLKWASHCYLADTNSTHFKRNNPLVCRVSTRCNHCSTGSKQVYLA